MYSYKTTSAAAQHSTALAKNSNNKYKYKYKYIIYNWSEVKMIMFVHRSNAIIKQFTAVSIAYTQSLTHLHQTHVTYEHLSVWSSPFVLVVRFVHAISIVTDANWADQIQITVHYNFWPFIWGRKRPPFPSFSNSIATTLKRASHVLRGSFISLLIQINAIFLVLLFCYVHVASLANRCWRFCGLLCFSYLWAHCFCPIIFRGKTCRASRNEINVGENGAQKSLIFIFHWLCIF